MSEDRDVLIAALGAEYATILREVGPWRERSYEATVHVRRHGARQALERMAERVGVTDLHERAAEGGQSASAQTDDATGHDGR